MRKIIVTEFISLDGVIETPAWTFKYWNDDIASFKGETSADEPLLLGRVTYEAFAAAQPNRTEDDDPGAAYFNSTRKYVVSTTLETLEWNNSVLISDNIVEEILRLKQEDGPDIVVHGSGNLIQTLMANNLVDRFRLLVYPVVLGKGQRLFTEATTATLELVESRAFGNGVVALIYQPAKAE